jgi:DNA-binding transcriptional LysR family regulator
MDINRIRYFLTVVETKSLRRASELLMISPAALSKALKILESEVGLTLLLPAGRGIDISYEGQLFARRVTPLVREMEALPKVIREEGFENTKSKPLRLGSFEVFTTYFLKALMESLSPDLELELRELIPGEMEKALVDEQIDYAINYLPIPTQGIDFVHAGSIEMGIFGRSDLIKGKNALDLPFAIPISPVSGTPNKVQGLDGWPEHKIARKTPYRVNLLETALELCRQGRAVIYAPSFLISEHNEYCQEKYRLKQMANPRGLGAQKFPVYLMKRKQDSETSTFNQIARAIRLSK